MNIKEFVKSGKLKNPIKFKKVTFKLDTCEIIEKILELSEFDELHLFTTRSDNKLILEYIFFAVFSNFTASSQKITIANLIAIRNFSKNVARFATLFGRKSSDAWKILQKFKLPFIVDVYDPLELVIYCYARYIDYLYYCVFNNNVENLVKEKTRVSWIHHVAYFLAISENGELKDLIQYFENIVSKFMKRDEGVKSFIYGRIFGEYDGKLLKGRYDLLTTNSILVDFDASVELDYDQVFNRLLIGAKIINKTYSNIHVREIIYINTISHTLVRLWVKR